MATKFVKLRYKIKSNLLLSEISWNDKYSICFSVTWITPMICNISTFLEKKRLQAYMWKLFWNFILYNSFSQMIVNELIIHVNDDLQIDKRNLKERCFKWVLKWENGNYSKRLQKNLINGIVQYPLAYVGKHEIEF